MNFFYEATDTTGKTVMGRLDAGSETEVRQRLQQMGFQPQAVALNPGSQTLQPAPTRPAEMLGGNSGYQPTIQASAAALRPTVAQSSVAPPTARSSGIILSGNAARTMNTTSQVGTGQRTGVHSAAPGADVSTLGGVNDRDRLFFFQQLAALVKSGMSIYAALDNLGPRTQNKNLSLVTSEMADAARNGGRISDVMEKYPRIFEEHIVGLIRAGELGGFLEISLSETALTYEQNLALFKGAWIPKMMATQALYGLALAIPAFPDLLYGAKLDAGIMPGVRLYLIHEAVLLPLTYLLIHLIKAAWARLQQPEWRRFRDEWTLRIPPYGDLHRQAALSAFIRMLRRLYHAGINPSAAWEGAMQTASNVVIRDRLAVAKDMMQRGVGLPEAFSATGLFNDNMEQMLTTGQISGQVVESLDQVAEFYQEQVQTSADKSRKAMFFAGRIVLLVLGGITMAWLLHSCYAATFHFVDENFKPPD